MGGVIFYCQRPAGEGGRIELVQHVLLGMDTMYEFVNDMISNIQNDVGMDGRGGVVLPDSLPASKRIKLCQEFVEKPAMSAGELLAKIACDRDDVACMRDVEDLSIEGPPPYVS